MRHKRIPIKAIHDPNELKNKTKQNFSDLGSREWERKKYNFNTKDNKNGEVMLEYEGKNFNRTQSDDKKENSKKGTKHVYVTNREQLIGQKFPS